MSELSDDEPNLLRYYAETRTTGQSAERNGRSYAGGPTGAGLQVLSEIPAATANNPGSGCQKSLQKSANPRICDLGGWRRRSNNSPELGVSGDS
jgi:hypothetical protein